MAERIEADVTCPVCLEVFEDPVLLRCLHTLCATCSRLPAVQIDPNTVQCPTCRHNTALGDVTNDFKTKNWVDLYRQLKAQEGAMGASAPPEAPPPYSLEVIDNTATRSTHQATQNVQQDGEQAKVMPQHMGFEHVTGGFASKAEEAAASGGNPYAPQFRSPTWSGGMNAPAAPMGAPGAPMNAPFAHMNAPLAHMNAPVAPMNAPGAPMIAPVAPMNAPAAPMNAPVAQMNPTAASMYPSLPPPSYTETIQPELVDESSLKHFINVDLNPEEVFKFRSKALTIRVVQQKAWVVLAEGGIKVFSRTGYQFGRYVTSDLQVHQHASALWSVVPFQGGSDKYVYRASAVTEAYNGDVIAACRGSNSWSVLPSFSRFKLDRAFDNVGLVHMNNIGTVQVIISSKHYTDVRSHGQRVYALPVSKSNKKVEIFHHDNNKWLLLSTVLVQPGVSQIALGHHWLFTSNTRANTGQTYVCKYDLSGQPKNTDKYIQYPHQTVDFAEGSKPHVCCVDPHGNSIVADSQNDCLVLVDRQNAHLPLRVKGRFKPCDVIMENTRTLLMLTENESGITRLVYLARV